MTALLTCTVLAGADGPVQIVGVTSSTYAFQTTTPDPMRDLGLAHSGHGRGHRFGSHRGLQPRPPFFFDHTVGPPVPGTHGRRRLSGGTRARGDAQAPRCEGPPGRGDTPWSPQPPPPGAVRTGHVRGAISRTRRLGRHRLLREPRPVEHQLGDLLGRTSVRSLHLVRLRGRPLQRRVLVPVFPGAADLRGRTGARLGGPRRLARVFRLGLILRLITLLCEPGRPVAATPARRPGRPPAKGPPHRLPGPFHQRPRSWPTRAELEPAARPPLPCSPRPRPRQGAMSPAGRRARSSMTPPPPTPSSSRPSPA